MHTHHHRRNDVVGADDKAGIAIIMQAVQTLYWTSPSSCMGRCGSSSPATRKSATASITSISIKLGADACYTLDGSGADVIDTETFSADLATITIRGVNIHPSIAYGKMVNAIRAAGYLLAALPRDMAPETTRERQGFLHPYMLEGQVDQVVLRVLLRDFETPRLSEQAARVREIVRRTEAEFPGSEWMCRSQPNIEIWVTDCLNARRSWPWRKPPIVIWVAPLVAKASAEVPTARG